MIYTLERRQVIQKKWKYSHFIRNNRVSAALLSQFKVHYDFRIQYTQSLFVLIGILPFIQATLKFRIEGLVAFHIHIVSK